MSNTDNIFSGFSPVSKQEWIEKVVKDLKGVDFDEKMLWKTQEGIELPPFYTSDDLGELEYLKKFESQLGKLGEYEPRTWYNAQYILVKDIKKANQSALIALEGGTDALFFDLSEFTHEVNFSVLLKDVKLEYCPVSFKVNDLMDFIEKYSSEIDLKSLSSNTFKGNVFGDISSNSAQSLIEVIQKKEGIQNWNSLGISLPENTSITEKIAEGIYQCVSCFNKILEESEDSTFTQKVAERLSFLYPVENFYFLEIAGLRAARLLLTEVIKNYEGLKDISPTDIHIHTYTTIANNEITQEDPYQNMLSNTTQAMSAIIGGGNSLSVLPHNFGIGEVDEFSARIARNVSNILKEESYFNKVIDPASGSYYIENLTDQIAKRAWAIFQGKISG